MFKKLFIILLLSVTPAFAGVLENSIKQGNYVFLYIYTPWCSACKEFTPVYEKLSQNNSGKYKFLKINAETPYGYELSKKFNIRYVPFTAIFKPKSGDGVQLSYTCAINYDCASKTMKDYTK